MSPRPPQSSTHVFSLASHHEVRWSSGTVPASTEQQGMGVDVFCAAAKLAKAEAATKMVE